MKKEMIVKNVHHVCQDTNLIGYVVRTDKELELHVSHVLEESFLLQTTRLCARIVVSVLTLLTIMNAFPKRTENVVLVLLGMGSSKTLKIIALSANNITKSTTKKRVREIIKK
ncbi:uncharacterized protein [Amphiura filiformis]|uniref:uncharacterized protein n=1 Tax=Amphiura filiformis TaxID=82378 RepID=UPI003B216CBB